VRTRYPTLVVGLCAFVTLAAAGQQPRSAGTPTPRPPRPAPRAATAFQLLAGSSFALALDANRVRCIFDNVGHQCTQIGDLYAGGSWPKSTGYPYLYSSGLQVAAIVPAWAGFGWSGDTVGAFLNDLNGSYGAGSALAGLYDSRRPADIENWPSAAYVRDTTFFDPSLLGLKAISEQDSWVRYWDAGATGFSRKHAMGLLVDQRTLAWNRPEGNRDVLYVLVRLINVTARDPSRYSGLSAFGYTAEDISEIARIGAEFHARSDTAGGNLPDSGFTWTRLYVGLAQDPDIGQFPLNDNSTPILPFAMAVAYNSRFNDPGWDWPTDVFAPPFASAPGLVGTKVLRAISGPVTGSSVVSMFTNFTGGDPFPSPRNVASLWRMLANHLTPADGSCNAPLGTPLCQLVQGYMDTRYAMGTGPWPDVLAGRAVSFAIAYVFAAPVASALQTDGQGRTLGNPNFDLVPGYPATGPHLAAGTDTVRQIERVAGWTGYFDANGNGDIEANEVQTLPRSLLAKAAAAQALADHKFVLPVPPAAPRFYVLPGDGQATVVWERSASEVTGDPYFALAADPLSPLYDANFRRNDVEGYRVWRGRTPEAMQLVAQFDYTGTSITDHAGQVFAGSVPETCAPELGIVAGCAADFAHGGIVNVPLSGTVIQVPWGGRVLLASGGALVLRADTAGTGLPAGAAPLRDTGVPFAFVDSGLLNGTTYVYAVTAFDVNSVNSGPVTMESERVVRTVTPRAASSNLHAALVATRLEGGDGSPLDTSLAFPAIDPNDGTFAGPIPPANGGTITLPAMVQELLPAGTFTLVVDSVGPGFADGTAGAGSPLVYFSVLGAPAATRGSAAISLSSAFPADPGGPYEYVGPFVPYDSAQERRFGVLFAPDARMVVRFAGLAPGLQASSPGVARAAVNGVGSAASRFLAHSRWFDEGGREPADPTITPFASASHTSGALTGVAAIFSPLPYRLPASAGAAHGVPRSYRIFLSATLAAWHPGDFVVRWGAGGQVTVTDLTHKVAVPYKGAIQPGYGFLNVSALAAAGVSSGQLSDGSVGVTFDPTVASYYSLRTIAPVCTSALSAPCVPLQPAAQLQPVDVTDDGVADGTGVALVLDGEPFFFLMTSLPAAGTAWHLRAVGGAGMTATCAPALPDASSDLLPGAEPTDCAGYAFAAPVTRPAYVPGLRYTIEVTRQFGADSVAPGDLARVHTVPDPFYVTNGQGLVGPPSIRFVNLPERAIIRIYTSSGILVTMLTHNDPTAGGEAVWDVTNRGGWHVASGVYFYHVETPDHRTKVGRFTVVQAVR